MVDLIPIRKKFVYEKLEQHNAETGRTYGDDHLPSMTHILSKTKDQSHLKQWEERVGKDEAERIKNEDGHRRHPHAQRDRTNDCLP